MLNNEQIMNNLYGVTEDKITEILGKGYNLLPLSDDNTWLYMYTIVMAEKIFNVDISHIRKIRTMLTSTFYKTFLDKNTEKICVIPHDSHRCWLTSPHQPYEIPDDKLAINIASMQMLSKKFNDWNHHFWCIDPTKIPKTIETLKKAAIEYNLKIIIHVIDEIKDKMLAYHVYQGILDDNRYANANDILRLNIINIYGGLYVDIGMQFNYDLTPIIDSYEYLWWIHPNGYLDTGIFACGKNNKILNMQLNLLDKLYLLSDEIKQITEKTLETPKNFYNQLAWTGCLLLMAIIDSICSGEEKMFFLINGEIVTLNNLYSWIKSTFGNIATKDTTLDIFQLFPVVTTT